VGVAFVRAEREFFISRPGIIVAPIEFEDRAIAIANESMDEYSAVLKAAI
jgi:hypothetical protein